MTMMKEICGKSGKNQGYFHFKEIKCHKTIKQRFGFGFVKFQKVVNAEVLKKKRLNLIWIGMWKLRPTCQNKI